MDKLLRDVWISEIDAGDYEAHMAAVGQAQANASHVAEYLATSALSRGTRILFVGAGTGQLFDFVSPKILNSHKITFADLNGSYLEKLASRLAAFPAIEFRTVVDDIEATRLQPEFDLVIAALVLEHVNWQTAVAALCRLASRQVFIVIQENPPDSQTAMTQTRPTVGTMNVFRRVHPTLVPRDDLRKEMARHHFEQILCNEKAVLDGKKMVGLGFTRSSKPDDQPSTQRSK